MTNKKVASQNPSADELERREFSERFVKWWNEGAEKSRWHKPESLEKTVKRKAA